MRTSCLVRAVMVAAMLCVSSRSDAQSEDHKWSVDVGLGWDNSISGNINSSAFGTLNGQSVVILKNQYEEVYGTGLHLRLGGGYRLNPDTEARVHITFQSLDADLVVMGDYGPSPLYGQYSDYQSLSVDFGMRRYTRVNTHMRPYVEGTIGIGFVDDNDLELIAPQSNLRQNFDDFYDETTAFTLGLNGGLLWNVNTNLGAFVQLGLRYVSGSGEGDFLMGTDLEQVNDNSQRWTLPFIVGVRYGF
jgi:hypothetical protein